MAVEAENSLAGRLTAENAVIGAMLIDETTVSPILAAVNASDICNPDNRRIFQAARALMLDGLPVDPVTIRDKLGQGIEERLIQLMEITPTRDRPPAGGTGAHPGYRGGAGWSCQRGRLPGAHRRAG